MQVCIRTGKYKITLGGSTLRALSPCLMHVSKCGGPRDFVVGSAHVYVLQGKGGEKGPAPGRQGIFQGTLVSRVVLQADLTQDLLLVRGHLVDSGK